MFEYTGIVQANLGRRSEAQLSLLNDEAMCNMALMLVTEPYVFDINGEAFVHQHAMWEAVRPSQVEKDRVVRSFRSLIYVNKRSQFRQIEIACSDIVGGILKLDSLVLVVASVYVPCIADGSRAENEALLLHRLDLVRTAWINARRRLGQEVQLFVGGDFNRHDQV